MKNVVYIFLYFQRLHRIITSAELVSAHESAKEMLGIVRNRDFSKLFMKSTIRVSTNMNGVLLVHGK